MSNDTERPPSPPVTEDGANGGLVWHTLTFRFATNGELSETKAALTKVTMANAVAELLHYRNIVSVDDLSLISEAHYE